MELLVPTGAQAVSERLLEKITTCGKLTTLTLERFLRSSDLRIHFSGIAHTARQALVGCLDFIFNLLIQTGIRKLGSDTNRILDCVCVRTAMSNDRHSLDPKKRRSAVF